MAKKSFVKINIRGGIISSGDLGNVVELLKKYSIATIELGERQNIYFYIDKKKKSIVSDDLTLAALDFEIDSNSNPNIISSYAAEDIFSTHPWLGEGIYRDILSSFQYKPTIKINISDNTQALVPLYTGCLNFIPSTHTNFFYIYINHPSLGDLKCFDKLIYATEIETISKAIESIIIKEGLSDIKKLSSDIDAQFKLITIDVDQPLLVPRLRFPYYEGMNKYGEKFWLGIYRRNNDFSVELLESIFNLCKQTRIGQINITPWKSIMVKGIAEEERIEWEKLLSRNGINSRHSSLELNWQLPDLNPEALRIKNELVKSFDEEDIRTYGISFAIYTGEKFDMCSSVIIKKRPSLFTFWGFMKKMTMYDIMFAPDFSLNATHYQTYTSNITWNGLAMNLKNLSQNYYKQLSKKGPVKKIVNEEKNTRIENLYQCPHCLSLYDEHYGEPENGIEKGVSFENLPESYKCPLCENPKVDFVKKYSEKSIV